MIYSDFKTKIQNSKIGGYSDRNRIEIETWITSAIIRYI